ncbi:hypothetical protein [Pseudomonas bijieensis]|uniref:Uncharacterized protein n=1 Tax=Pseudomonas bijieensis TaxID=2681983 RepID=A0A6N1C7V5_9PSED|nr:hypothetical protein [Pseudomonas bijieensis]QIB08168.1 hypothetical protein GZ982_26720 [Pseudomonas fluorescens]QKS80575.1 hypothetical protein GN234_00845 [Pseudomonas bijieensis]
MATQKTTHVAGDLDPGFGHEGRAFFTLDQSLFGGSSKLLSDGKILTAGVNASAFKATKPKNGLWPFNPTIKSWQQGAPWGSLITANITLMRLLENSALAL